VALEAHKTAKQEPNATRRHAVDMAPSTQHRVVVCATQASREHTVAFLANVAHMDRWVTVANANATLALLDTTASLSAMSRTRAVATGVVRLLANASVIHASAVPTAWRSVLEVARVLQTHAFVRLATMAHSVRRCARTMASVSLAAASATTFGWVPSVRFLAVLDLTATAMDTVHATASCTNAFATWAGKAMLVRLPFVQATAMGAVTATLRTSSSHGV
jgi:hypothetical protein